MSLDARCIPLFTADLVGESSHRQFAAAASFTAEVGTSLLMPDDVPTLLVGCGDPGQLTETSLRIAFAAAGRSLTHLERVEIDLKAITAEMMSPELRDKVVAEGLILGSYRFDKHQTHPAPKPPVTWVPAAPSPGWETGVRVAEAVVEARDVVNEPANVVTPETLADHIVRVGEASGLAVTVRDEAWLVGAGAGGILGIGQGSEQRPRMVEIVHAGDGGEVDLCLVGKGVTFDAGGLSLKDSAALIGMQFDMAAVATIAHAMALLSTVAPSLHVRAYCPLVENMPGPYSIRPGDIVTTRNGKTIEVLNTDFEGRTILADGLAFAAEQKPRHLVDIATLTYGAPNSIGPRMGALFGVGEAVNLMGRAADRSGELVWPLPMLEYMMPTIRSRVADVKNFPYEPKARATTAAMFLREFVPAETSWAHLDIAGPGWADEAYELNPAGATGFGLRLLLELFVLLADDAS